MNDSRMPRPYFLLPPVIDAVATWRASPDDERARAVGAALTEVARVLELEPGRLRISAPPLPDLDLELGTRTTGAELVLRAPGDETPLGSMRVAGNPELAEELARAISIVFIAARAGARAERSARQMHALDQAVRGISGVLDVDRVLQMIVDRVRDLVEAQYAAIGIVDDQGVIETFVTSGISDEDRRRIGELPHGHGLLGLIIRENRPYRISDITAHPQRYGFPPYHPEMHSFLGMPITAQGVAAGRLYLTNKLGPAEFSVEDQELVEMFALHAGIAIDNARLHDEVRRLAVVDERERISRDLHDSAIQSIYAQTLALDDVPELMDEAPDQARLRIDEAIDGLHAVIRDIRNFIFGLRPVLMESGSLTTGLEHLATELHRSGGVEVEVGVSDPDDHVASLSIEVVAELLAVTREALSNISRHAAANRAELRLVAQPTLLTLEISDNGRGFAADRSSERGHHGLANMRARVERIGGRFELASGSEHGTRIIVTLPRHPAANEGVQDR
ncbi:MAG: GAF domain-containing sensor histidine kinase [Candidatus Limnocylindria bacterium]